MKASPLGADPAHDYARVARAIHFLSENFLAQPDLAEAARSVHLSPYHFQRLFTRWAGVSPKRFVQFLTVEHAKARLAEAHDVLSTSLDSGLSSPGRLHDLFVGVEALSPGEYKNGGAGLTVRYGVHLGPFGPCLIAVTSRGICGLAFFEAKDGSAIALADLRRKWPAATLTEDAGATAPTAAAIFRPRRAGLAPRDLPPLLLAGTNFQIQVWTALLRIAPGGLATYADIAALIGHPRAARAVGTAVGQNAIAYLIPCHRVIQKSGVLGDYRWGTTRKQALVGWEAARAARHRQA